MPQKKETRTKTVTKPVNYTLENPKISFDFLKSHLWNAADILRGSLDPSEYRQPVMTLLFLKRLNDTFDENAEKMIQKGSQPVYRGSKVFVAKKTNAKEFLWWCSNKFKGRW